MAPAPVAPRGWGRGRGTARPRADVARREKESARDRVRYSSRGRVEGRGRLPGMRPSAPGGEGAGRRRSRRGSGSMQLGGVREIQPQPRDRKGFDFLRRRRAGGENSNCSI